MKTAIILLVGIALMTVPGASADCHDLAGNGEACADVGPESGDVTVDVANEDAGVTAHVGVHYTLG